LSSEATECVCGYDAVKIVKALYDFAPLQDDDLAFSKGDKMKILPSDDTSVIMMYSRIRSIV